LTERLNVLKSTEGLTDDEMCEPMGEGKWSIKDTLGHLAAWEGEVVKAFEQKARGERPTIGDINDFEAWNTEQSAKRKDSSVEAIRHEINETRKRLLTILNGLPDEGDVWSPERSTAKMLDMLLEHDRHHWKSICRHRRIECE
jgi:uncharacterized damage-inducible protein DinB